MFAYLATTLTQTVDSVSFILRLSKSPPLTLGEILPARAFKAVILELIMSIFPVTFRASFWGSNLTHTLSKTKWT